MGIIRSRPEPKLIEHRYHAGEMELALVKHFDFRRNVIVPNIFINGWHECDLLMLSQSNHASEVEIKVSASDLKADAKKTHGHRSKRVRLLWFAIPKYLEPYIMHVPLNAGIILVHRVAVGDTGWNDVCSALRGPTVNRDAKKWDTEQRLDLLRLAAMRIWPLKERVQRLVREKHRG